MLQLTVDVPDVVSVQVPEDDPFEWVLWDEELNCRIGAFRSAYMRLIRELKVKNET